MDHKNLKQLALGAAIAGAMATVPAAQANPFAVTALGNAYMAADDAGAAKDAEGKCGGDKAEGEHKCGADKAAGEHKCGADKAEGEHKCGADMKEGAKDAGEKKPE